MKCVGHRIFSSPQTDQDNRGEPSDETKSPSPDPFYISNRSGDSIIAAVRLQLTEGTTVRRLLLSILVFHIFADIALAQKFVVELEATVFERHLTAEENAAIQIEMQKLPRSSQGRFYSKERLRILRKNAGVLESVSSTLLCDQTGVNSWSATTSKLENEAKFRIVGSTDQDCEIDLNWALRFQTIGASSSTSGLRSKFTLPLDEKIALGGGGAKGWNIVFAISVRGATKMDLEMTGKSPFTSIPLRRLEKQSNNAINSNSPSSG